MANTYAVITGGLISNIVMADDTFITAHLSGAVRIDNLTPVPAVGWSYANGVFTAPAPPTPAKQTVFAKIEFRRFLTIPQLVVIDNFASSTTLTADQKATIYTILRNFDAADSIDLADPLTVQGVNYLATLGLIPPAIAAKMTA